MDRVAGEQENAVGEDQLSHIWIMWNLDFHTHTTHKNNTHILIHTRYMTAEKTLFGGGSEKQGEVQEGTVGVNISRV